jgi:Flp pilus assembly protein TadD
LYLKELYLRGRHSELSRSLVGIQTAKEAYRRAVERDSSFALGYAGLAGVYGFEADYGYAPVRPALDSARMMARRAVELDSMLPETRTALAVTLGDAHHFEQAEREFKRAIELSPSNARAHYWYSVLLVALGRGEEALREARRAADLDPFAPRGVLAMQRYAEYLLSGERPYLEQLPVQERRPILKLEPGEPWAHAAGAVELADEGKCAEARSEIHRAQQLVPPDNIRMLPFVGAVYWRCGERIRARGVLAQMKQRADAGDHGFRIARLHTLFSEKDSAFTWLDRQRWTMAELAGLSADRTLDPLRSDPRYAQLLRQLGVRKA